MRHRVSPSTQNQALSALLFLFKEILASELPWLQDVRRAKPRKHVPVVLSREEVRALLAQFEGDEIEVEVKPIGKLRQTIAVG